MSKFQHCPVYNTCTETDCVEHPENCLLVPPDTYSFFTMQCGHIYHIAIPKHGYVDSMCVHRISHQETLIQPSDIAKCLFTRFGWFYYDAKGARLISELDKPTLFELPLYGWISGQSPVDLSPAYLRLKPTKQNNLFMQ